MTHPTTPILGPTAEVDARLLLRERWGIEADAVEPLAGRRDSETWKVSRGNGRWVLTSVPARDSRSFVAGLVVAAALDERGLAAGAPVRDLTGRLHTPDRRTALLRWVDGEPLAPADAPLIGRTLGRTHRLLAGLTVPRVPALARLDPDAAHLDVQDWVRPAVRRAAEEADSWRGAARTWGLLHGDPGPGAFRAGPHGVGIIDWAACVRGPFAYDVASAAMYVGPARAADLVAAYRTVSGVGEDELAAMLRFRWAVQADHFARRLAEGDVPGTDEAGDVTGLREAFEALSCAGG